MIKVGLLGLGFMGQMHFNCYKKNPHAQIVAVADRNADKLTGNARVQGNIGGNEPFDFSGLRTTTDLKSLLHDPEIDLVDLCLPTRQHAEYTIEALLAGKHVLCEKPMAFTLEECDAVVAAQKESGKSLLVGHCLRFWPQYVKAKELIEDGSLGDVLYARLFRVSGAPTWSKWLMDGAQSGGVVLDLHVHDIDTAQWWFGVPDAVQTTGLVHEELPLRVDAAWTYIGGPKVQIHGGWDRNGANFAMGFEIVGTTASLAWDSSHGEAMHLSKGGETHPLEVSGPGGYQAEIDYLLECIVQKKPLSTLTPESSRTSVKLAREELRQLGFNQPGL